MPHMYKYSCYVCDKELNHSRLPSVEVTDWDGEPVEVDIDDGFVDFVLMCKKCYAKFRQDEWHHDDAKYWDREEEADMKLSLDIWVDEDDEN